MNSAVVFCTEIWSEEIELSGGDYDADFYKISQSTAEIPSSALCGCTFSPSGTVCCELGERLDDAQTWLKNNYVYWDYCDAVIVMDYYGADDDSIGVGYLDAAGTNYKVGLVDMSWEDDGYMDSGYFSRVKSEGTVQHELSHVYSCRHTDGSVYSDDTTSIITPSTGASSYCYNNGSLIVREKQHSSCSEGNIRNYISNCDTCSSK